jgi:uncharacterized protein (DUF488 family)
MRFYSIGVYNSNEKEFFRKLVENNIDTFCDIRQRRAVRGSTFSFANSIRLQKELLQLHITYLHIPELSAPKQIRSLQYYADKLKGESLRNRNSLSQEFISAYKNQILDHFDFNNFILRLKEMGAKRIVFFCVEEKAEACHRSLVTEKLIREFKFVVQHL